MSIAHLLEDFDDLIQGVPVSMTDISIEELRLEAFEKGYQAGWDDAVKSRHEDERTVSVELQQNLQDLTFTYEEARSAVVDSVAPLIRQMVETVLPELAKASLPFRIAEEVEVLAKSASEQPIEIHAFPGDVPAIGPMLDGSDFSRISVIGDDTLPEGQVRIVTGDTEREIDLPETLRNVGDIVASFFQTQKRDIA